MSRSPSPNQVGSAPYAASSALTLHVSSDLPQPCSSWMPPPSVYITVSRSGQMRRPNSVRSSPVFPITVTSASGSAASRPRRNRAPPTPPASTVIRTVVPSSVPVPNPATLCPAEDLALVGGPPQDARRGLCRRPAEDSSERIPPNRLTDGDRRACNFTRIIHLSTQPSQPRGSLSIVHRPSRERRRGHEGRRRRHERAQRQHHPGCVGRSGGRGDVLAGARAVCPDRS